MRRGGRMDLKQAHQQVIWAMSTYQANVGKNFELALHNLISDLTRAQDEISSDEPYYAELENFIDDLRHIQQLYEERMERMKYDIQQLLNDI